MNANENFEMCRFWSRYLLNRVRCCAQLLSSILIRIDRINFCLVSVIADYTYYFHMLHFLCQLLADKNRMILSGEYPDYIHAVSANVS